MRKSASPAEAKTSTKERILDTAEELFSWNGYHGVSLRDIANKAEIPIALTNYHFGTKAELLKQVLGRRQAEFCALVYKSLDAARAAAGGKVLTVEAIIEAYVTPVFQKCASGNAGWRNYTRLVGNVTKLGIDGSMNETVAEYFDPLTRRVGMELEEALPGCGKEQIYWSLHFLVSALVHILGETILGETATIDRVSDGVCDTSNFARIRSAIIPFFAAGFYRLVGHQIDEQPFDPE